MRIVVLLYLEHLYTLSIQFSTQFIFVFLYDYTYKGSFVFLNRTH